MSLAQALWSLSAAVAMLVVGPIVYLLVSRIAFRKERRAPESALDPAQVTRYAPYAFAVDLQLATNRTHNKAIKAKKAYHMIGIAASSVGPAMIVLSTMSIIGKPPAWLSEPQLQLTEALLIIALICLVFLNKKPTDAFCRVRLHCELLRVHLHSYLAGVGPYKDAKNTTIDVERLSQRVGMLSTEEIQEELRQIGDDCMRQSVLPSDDVHRVTHYVISTYVEERVSEQAAFFGEAHGRQERAYRRSTSIVCLALMCASAAALWRCLDQRVDAVAGAIIAVSSATGVLVLALRAVFGWDSRAELYYKQRRHLQKVGECLLAIVQKVKGGALDRDTAVSFKMLACEYESLMAREACDWAMISDRRYYDASI